MAAWNRFYALLVDKAPILVSEIAVAFFILFVAWIVARVFSSAAERTLSRRENKTLAPVARGLVKVFVVGIGAVMALDHVGIDVAALLAGAGIAGLAVGFGAQSLVKDVISGFFLIFDDVLRSGDIANVGPATGVVEEVGLRMTKVRSFDGQLWHVPNGNISNVGSFSRGWCRAVVEVGLAYEGDVSQGLKVLQEVGDTWAGEHADLVLEAPEAQGVLGLNASDVGVRLVIKVKAAEQWGAERELRRRVKDAFDRAGVEIPFPRHVVYQRAEESEGTSNAA